MKILVIGGAGYIGSHVTYELCDQGYDVTVFDNLSTGFKSNIDKRAKFIKGDIINKNDLEKIFINKFNAIFHFAALKSVGDSMCYPDKYLKVNLIGTINILNKMVEHNIRNIIFSSTAAVYGLPKYLPVNEKHSLEPINFYGFTKLEMERIISWFSRLKGIRFSILRYFNAAGYDIQGSIDKIEKNPQNLLPIVMETALGRKDLIEIFGNDYDTFDGTGIRDYIHVNDLAHAHIFSLKYIMKNNENLTLNLATGEGYSVLEVIKITEKITNKKIKYRVVDRRDGDPGELVAKSLLAKEKINWECSVSNMEAILSSMWNVYSKIKN